jgi:uncharacterized protein (DUF1684 family)
MAISRLAFPAFSLLLLQVSQASYQAEIEKWRHEREAALKADDGWLTVAGLFWLKEGKNTVGTDPANNFVLPKRSAPGSVGVFEFHNGGTTFQATAGVPVTLNGKPTTRATLKPDTSGSPDILRIHDLTMFVIQRGSRFGIRVKDKNSERRRAFTGLKYFPVSERYRIRAKFVPYNPPKKLAVPNILGDVEEETSPGYVVFTANGQQCQLDPVGEGAGLFFIFKDLTAEKETYPSGRFLFAELPKNGEVVLDFNKAVNPPCAFTPFATCPLPPKQNYLPARIEAGELRYGH